MKIQLLDKNETELFLERAEFNVAKYYQFLDSDDVNTEEHKQFVIPIVPPFTSEKQFESIQERATFALSGVEKARALSSVFAPILGKTVLLMHEFVSGPWIPPKYVKDPFVLTIADALSQSGRIVDYSKFDGAILFPDGIGSVIEAFFPYPYVLGYLDLLFVPKAGKFVLKIDHHLRVILILQ